MGPLEAQLDIVLARTDVLEWRPAGPAVQRHRIELAVGDRELESPVGPGRGTGQGDEPPTTGAGVVHSVYVDGTRVMKGKQPGRKVPDTAVFCQAPDGRGRASASKPEEIRMRGPR